MEKVYRILGTFVLVLLLTAIGVLAVNNGSTRRELADLRSDYSELAERNRSLEERIAYYAGLAQFINDEVAELDKEFRRASSAAGSGLSGLQAQVDALRKWGAGHKQLEQTIIERLNQDPGN
jgi:predicted  nucleic acid-binding Zn-ribbon protein